jgi:hypothetical protein
MMDKGLMSREDLIKHYNKDISDVDLKTLMDRVDESKQAEAEATKPVSPIQRILGG